MVSDSLLFDASSLFFAAWFAVIAVVGLAAFGRDFIPVKTPLDAVKKGQAADSIGSGDRRR